MRSIQARINRAAHTESRHFGFKDAVRRNICAGHPGCLDEASKCPDLDLEEKVNSEAFCNIKRMALFARHQNLDLGFSDGVARSTKHYTDAGSSVHGAPNTTPVQV